MAKKKALVIALSVLCSVVFAQTIETVKYFDVIVQRTVTIQALHIGWQHDYHTISGAGSQSARLLIYSSQEFLPELAAQAGMASGWSDWQISSTEPIPYADVNELIKRKNVFATVSAQHPGTPMGSQAGQSMGGQALKIAVPPINKSLPYWFDEQNRLNIFYNLYMVIP